MMTYILVALTALVSIPAFSNNEWFLKMQFNAYQIVHRKEYYRMITHGLLHSNWMHLIVNMLVLIFFGPNVEKYLSAILSPGLQPWSHLVYVLFYFGAMIIASLTSLFRHKDDPWYNAVGASGAVSAVLFLFIFMNPWELLYLYGVIPIPGIISGVLYLIYSHYMSRKGTDQINHDAHISGAIFGFVFPLIINYRLIFYFMDQLLSR